MGPIVPGDSSLVIVEETTMSEVDPGDSSWVVVDGTTVALGTWGGGATVPTCQLQRVTSKAVSGTYSEVTH